MAHDNDNANDNNNDNDNDNDNDNGEWTMAFFNLNIPSNIDFKVNGSAVFYVSFRCVVF